MAMIVEDGKFVLRETSTTQQYEKELATAGKYVDRNIKIDVSAQDGALSADVSVSSGSASMGASGFTKSADATDYYVSLTTTSGYATGKASVATEGWVDSTDNKSSGAKSVSVTGNGTKLYIPSATISGAVADLISPSVDVSGSATGFTASETETSYYVTVQGAGTDGSVKAKASTGSASGMVSGNSSVISDATAVPPTINGSGTKVYIPAGGYTATVASHSISTTPVVTPSIGGTATSISTTTKPASGTDGTDYWTLDPGGSVTTTGKSTATGKATIGTGGYIPQNTTGKTSSASTVNITPTVADGSNRYISKATSTKTNGTVTVTDGTASTTVTGMKTTTTNTGYAVSATATGGNASITASTVSLGVGYNPEAVTASTAAASKTGTTKSDTKYIQKGVLGAGVSGNITFTPSVSTSMVTITKPDTGEEGTDYFAITGSGSKTGTVTGTAKVTTEGYVKSETATGGSAAGSIGADAVKYVAKAVLGASGTASATTTVAPGSVTINNGASDISGKEKLSITPVTSTSSVSDYYIPLKATAAANTTGTTSTISGTASASVSTAGYAPSGVTGSGSVSGTATAKTSAKSSSNYYIPLAKTTYSSSLPSGMTESQFTDISSSAPALVSGGYLYIKEGYNKNQKISLAKLVPDGASLVGGSSDSIVSGATAYDNDGKLITGTLAANSQSGALVPDGALTSGYSYYRITTTKGHNKDKVLTTDIPVYQGDWVV